MSWTRSPRRLSCRCSAARWIELAAVDPLLADVVDLKFFCGFSVPEIAAMKGVSERTIERSWQKARLFLHRAVRQDLLRE